MLCGMPAACRMAAPLPGLRFMISRLRRCNVLFRSVSFEILWAHPRAAAGSDWPSEKAREEAAASRVSPGLRVLTQLAAAFRSSRLHCLTIWLMSRACAGGWVGAVDQLVAASGSWLAQLRSPWLTGERQPPSLETWAAWAAAACGSVVDHCRKII